MSAETDRALLAGCVLFAGSEPPQWFCEGAESVAAARGEVVYSPENFPRALALVAEGLFDVENASGIALNALRRGALFGVAAAFGECERYVSTVRAHTGGRVLLLPSALLERLFLERPDCALRYVAFLTDRVRFLNAKIESFTAPSVQDSLARWLFTAADGAESVEVASWSAVGRALGVSRTSLYRALDALETDGRIAREGKKVILK